MDFSAHWRPIRKPSAFHGTAPGSLETVEWATVLARDVHSLYGGIASIGRVRREQAPRQNKEEQICDRSRKRGQTGVGG